MPANLLLSCSSELRPSSSKSIQRAEAEAAWLRLYHTHGLPVHVFRLGGDSIYTFLTSCICLAFSCCTLLIQALLFTRSTLPRLCRSTNVPDSMFTTQACTKESHIKLRVAQSRRSCPCPASLAGAGHGSVPRFADTDTFPDGFDLMQVFTAQDVAPWTLQTRK